MMRNLITLALLLVGLWAGAVSAQQVKGVVKDQKGEPLPGVSIMIIGTTQGVTTDFDGNFNIEVPNTQTSALKFQFMGMKSQEVLLKGKTSLSITMEDETSMLDEVVAIGYATQKRKDVTGSVASVSADALVAVPVASATEALTGRMAGVQITTTEGSPDAEMKIRVRGGGSITGDNTPLFIVDGFPVESISDIAPSDIESIDVLKDASSSAIYGSRGANGVVIITTKSGKAGKVSVSYNAFYSWKKVAKTLDVLGAADYAKWNYELAMLKNNEPDEVNPESYTKFFGNYEDIDLYNNIPTNDWQEQTFGRTGHTFNHNLSITGGSEKTKYSFGYSMVDDKAIMQMSNFKRDNVSFKMNTKPNEKIALDFSVRFSKTKINGGGANESKNEKSSADSRLKHAMLYTPFPIDGLTNLDAGETDESFNLYNPIENLADNDRQQVRKTLNMGAAFTWEFFRGIKFKSEWGYDDYRNNDSRFYGLTTYYIKNAPTSENQGKPAAIFTNTQREKIRNTNTINVDFKKYIKNEDHNLNLLVGEEYIIQKSEVLTSTVHGLPLTFKSADAFKLSALGAANSIDNFLNPDDKLFSFFGRLNYDYQSKYIASATLRADGSSKFTKGNQWGYFPSAAVAWRVSSESFMENTKEWLDDLKLRFSYGTAGNNNIPSGQTVQNYKASATTWINGVASYWAPAKAMANDDLKWETTITRNIGLDFTLFGGKLNGSFETYWNTTKGLLMEFPVAGTGYDTQYRNMGKTQNQGFEVSINWVAIDTDDFGLNISANVGFNKNKIKSLGIMEDFGYSSDWASTEIGQDFWVAKGGRVGKMYGYKSAGRYETSDFEGYDAGTNKWILKDGVVDASAIVGTLRPGSLKLQDLSGANGEKDGSVNTYDRTIIGDANPVHTGGLNINARAYGFDLAANFNWSVGNDIYNANKIEYTSTSKYQYRNMLTEMADGKRWTNLRTDGTLSTDLAELAAMNANTTMWSPYMDRFVFTDWAVEDGSFLRLSTLTLGYTLPKLFTQKYSIQTLRFYATCYNVFCLTDYSGFDPEVSTRVKSNLTPGVDYSAYPKSRQFVIGLNLNF